MRKRTIDDIEWDLNSAFQNRSDAERALEEAKKWYEEADKEVDALCEELEVAKERDDE